MQMPKAFAVAFFAACVAGSSVTASELASAPGTAVQLATAEKFIDAFYSFDAARLAPFVSAATEASRGEIVFYQQWAVGAHYSVVHRHPCRIERVDVVACAVTVEDDLMKALQIDFNVTDEFHLSFRNGTITEITTTSDDPPAWENGKAWIRKNRAALIATPCEGYFAGGPTPAECARSMVQGLREFRESPEYQAGR